MATHSAEIEWTLESGADFPKGRYSRGHTLRFDGGIEVPGSAAPQVLGPWAVEAAVDPEEMLVAALASCHMMSFLHVARQSGLTILSYRDHAEGLLERIGPGRHAITNVALDPSIEWSGPTPDAATLDRLHHEAHDICFIANSVKTTVTWR